MTNTFFITWELWQQMTFVLGCSIFVVVLLGVFKLWLANRRLQAHEVIDEERRARIAEMNYCGIRHLKHNSIPFGARAIEQGQKVEGIWNSCREVPQPSQATSSAILENDHNNLTPQYEGVIYSSLHGIQEEIARPISPSSAALTHSSAPSSTYHDCRSMSHPEDDVDEMNTSPLLTDEDSRTCQPLKADEVSLRDLKIASTSSLPAAVGSNNIEPLPVSTRAPCTPKERTYGSAQVYANTERRNMHSGFEILPAGTLGARPEFQIRSSALQHSDQ